MSAPETVLVTAADVKLLFRDAMRRLVTTVSIVTTVADGVPSGMTATAVTSLSAEPPAILVCVNRQASIHPVLRLGGPLCVNLLHADHGPLSAAFGGKVAPGERFQGEDWVLDDVGLPHLRNAQANLFCTIDGLFDYATHTIVVGRVERVLLNGSLRPLLYGDGRYLDLGLPTERTS